MKNKDDSYLFVIFFGLLLFVACGVKLYIDTQAIENRETTKGYLVDYIMHDSVNMRDRFWTGV